MFSQKNESFLVKKMPKIFIGTEPKYAFTFIFLCFLYCSSKLVFLIKRGVDDFAKDALIKFSIFLKQTS